MNFGNSGYELCFMYFYLHGKITATFTICRFKRVLFLRYR
uniref:Uncharacterized protein n=1 Tax=Anguilla anguilla TaxID=7936 RepID=A0A0E9PJ71_ANGAN